jgi:hypothetical protein
LKTTAEFFARDATGRHERRKDKEYQESKEEQRRAFEKDILGSKALEIRIRE